MKLRDVLTAWQVPGGSEASFSVEQQLSVLLQHRKREDRGKGMRSVLHAAFSVALSEYCLEEGLPHPGFVVLDTPVLTYRDAAPIAGASEVSDLENVLFDGGDDELLSGSVAAAFYSYLGTSHAGQAIVLENQTPPHVDAAGCSVIYFTGGIGTGRSGFYPPIRMS
ncbi:hypothetical protein [Nocardioides phosphati]|nr:hypothetical protein [Nocardioides phosphati]